MYMSKILIVIVLFSLCTFPSLTFARVTPEDIYNEKRSAYEQRLASIQDPLKKEKMQKADLLLQEINQKISSRFDEDVAKLAAVLEELKSRIGAEGQSTIVAYGQGETKLDSAAYWLNYAAEAVAYQKIQDYTPQFSTEAQLAGSVGTSMNRLSGDLGVLRNKIIRAKNEMSKIVAFYEK